MAGKVRLKLDRSFREHAVQILPAMLGKFLSFRDQIENGGRDTDRLHRMRIAGKPLRYMMEASQPAFGAEFASCLREIEEALSVMGAIHECDVSIPVLADFHEEMKILNARVRDPKTDLQAKPVSNLVRLQKRKRSKLLRDLKTMLARWEREDFPARLAKSMEQRASRPKRYRRP